MLINMWSTALNSTTLNSTTLNSTALNSTALYNKIRSLFVWRDTVINQTFQPGGSGWLFALDLIKTDASAIVKIPVDLKNMRFYHEAVNVNGMVIGYISGILTSPGADSWNNYQLYRTAVKQNIDAIDCVPPKYMTNDLLIDFVRTGVATVDSKYGNKAVFRIPYYLLTENIIVEAVRVNKHLLPLLEEVVDKKLITERVYLEAK